MLDKNRFAASPLPDGKHLVFILGTGRCGFKSMHHLLSLQPNVWADYEYVRFPWHDPSNSGIMRHIVRAYGILSMYKEVNIWVGISHTYLPYVDRIIEKYPTAKFVCMIRDKESTVKSLILDSKTRNFWTNTNSKHWLLTDSRGKMYNSFPHFDLPKEEGCKAYWDYYKDKYFSIYKVYENCSICWVPNFFDTDMAHQDAILKFIGIPSPTIKQGVKVR